jgi:hypothetical protein
MSTPLILYSFQDHLDVLFPLSHFNETTTEMSATPRVWLSIFGIAFWDDGFVDPRCGFFEGST